MSPYKHTNKQTNQIELAFHRMTFQPFPCLLTCLRPLFLPSGCWIRRFCWPGSLCTLATLSSTNALVYLERVQNTLWASAQITYMKRSLQRYCYLWRKVGKESLRWEFFKGLGARSRPGIPKLPKLRFCFQSLMLYLSFNKTFVWSHPWFGSHQKVWDVIFWSQFFFPRGGEKVVTNEHKQVLPHGWEHLFKNSV